MFLVPGIHRYACGTCCDSNRWFTQFDYISPSLHTMFQIRNGNDMRKLPKRYALSYSKLLSCIRHLTKTTSKGKQKKTKLIYSVQRETLTTTAAAVELLTNNRILFTAYTNVSITKQQFVTILN